MSRARAIAVHRVLPWLLLMIFGCDLVAAGEALSPEKPGILIYPKVNRNPYPKMLLARALEVAGKPHSLVASTGNYSQKRGLTALANGEGIDVNWSMTTDLRESMLLPIRIPIYKGLIGWRLFLIKAANWHQFAEVSQAQDLHAYTAGQMHDWPDSAILEWNGMDVFKGSTYEGLFKMLAMGRIDYFPRSAIEIWGELEERPDLGLAVEPSIVLHYPTAVYFFVSRSRPDLHALITEGLNKLIDSGEFDRLFMQRYGKIIARAQLQDRRKIKLDNHILPSLTPVDSDSLWYSEGVQPTNTE